MRLIYLPFLLCLFSLTLSFRGLGADNLPSVEQSSGADLQHYLAADEVISLKSGDQPFVALSKPAMTAFTKGSVILVPDWSQHAASPRMINLLRQQLVDYGWNTLAIMVPDPLPQSTAENLLSYQTELAQRMKAAIAQLEKNSGYMIVIAQGSSAGMLNQLYESKQLPSPDGLILLSAYLADRDLNNAMSLALAKHKIPTLDIMQQLDNSSVLSSSQYRLQLMRKHLKEIYRQRLLPGSVDELHNQQWVFNEIYGFLTFLGF